MGKVQEEEKGAEDLHLGKFLAKGAEDLHLVKSPAKLLLCPFRQKFSSNPMGCNRIYGGLQKQQSSLTDNLYDYIKTAAHIISNMKEN